MPPPAARRPAVRELATAGKLEAAAALLAGISKEPGGPISSEVLSALVLSRNDVAGAKDAPVSPGPVELHSHLTGLERSARRSEGAPAPEPHQRASAGEHRIASISWTFDPLHRRHAPISRLRLVAGAGRRPVERPAPAPRQVAVALPAAVGLPRSPIRRPIGGAIEGDGRLLGLDTEVRYVLEGTGGAETR